MIFGSIRFRLTTWYLVMLALGLGVFGVGSWFAMRISAFHTIDEELEDRIHGVDKFMQLQIASLSPAEIRDEFREHSVLGPGGDLFQVCNEKGQWLYRSAVLENNQIPIRLPNGPEDQPIYENSTVQGSELRFATARVVVNGHPYAVQVAATLSEFNEALERFRLILLFSAPLLLIGAGAGGYLISRRALRPVDQITAAAESISISNLKNRLEVPKTSDELQRLSETLNRMLTRLDDAVQRMSQFTADASHELRAPVALIRTTAELAVQDGRTNADYHDDMRQILGEAERTSRLIESLLLLARADSGEDGFHRETVDWALSIREGIAQTRSFAATRKIEIRADLPDDVVPVSGDSEALRRLIFILLDNAIKYSPESATICVSLGTDVRAAICRVADAGVGIAAEDIPRIFDRFWRADRVRSRGSGGSGLGLAIAKWIVDRHNGAIAVQSVVGKGSVFEVRLPLVDSRQQNYAL